MSELTYLTHVFFLRKIITSTRMYPILNHSSYATSRSFKTGGPLQIT